MRDRGIGLVTGMMGGAAAFIVAPYVLGWLGAPLLPWAVAAAAVAAGTAVGVAASRAAVASADPEPVALFGAVALVVAGWLVAVSPAGLVPPGGEPDLTHHLMLVDVLERTRHLVEEPSAGVRLAEMAHYTPGLHLAAVVVGALTGLGGWRVIYALVIGATALKAGLLSLVAWRVLGRIPARVPLAVAAVGFVLFVPRAYAVGGVLQSGFFAQVAAELWVVAGWWALTRWSAAPARVWMATVGLCAAAAFLTWPIDAGPLVLATAVVCAWRPGASRSAARDDVGWAFVPVAVVAAMHLWRHAAWLAMAATSGAVPAFRIDAAFVVLALLAGGGLAAARQRASAGVLRVLFAAIALQAVALWMLAAARGGEPYMAVKMIYLGALPLAVCGAVGLAWVVSRLPRALSGVGGWAAAAAVCAAAVRLAAGVAVPAPVVSVDLHEAGEWARGHVAPECVDYIVANRDAAYWLHLAVLGNARVTARTAALDTYSTNATIGGWIEGTGAPYAVADRRLVPAEVMASATVVRSFGTAAVLTRPPRPGDPRCGL